MRPEDKPREACGVIGIYSPTEPAARLAYFGLHALQHRGQEAAGIAVGDGHQLRVHKDIGLVAQVFTDNDLQQLTGYTAIGHTRYTTSGTNTVADAQPLMLDTKQGPLALAHNGNLTNTAALRQMLTSQYPSKVLPTASDSSLMLFMLAEQVAKTPQTDWATCLQTVMPQWEGAYSLSLTSQATLMAVRDPWGFRPLHLGKLPQGYAIASETGALQALGCTALREVLPGEIIVIDKTGQRSIQGQKPVNPLARCTFEHLYFSRPDTSWDGFNVHQVRQRLGKLLASEMKIAADLVIPVPDSAVPAAIAFSQATGILYNEGFIKNRYMGRTFIQPTDSLRKQGVALKFNTIPENLRGKRVIMIDDSIVRGNTSGPLVQMLRKAGALEVHLGITCPPIRHPCYMGIDMGTYKELIAHTRDTKAMCRHFGCDSLHFLSIEAMMQAFNHRTGYCNACFTGQYPLRIPSSEL